MHPLPGEGVQVGGQRGHEGLSFSRGHFRDPAGMEHHPADQLDVERNHFPGDLLPADPDLPLFLREPPAAVLHHRKSLREHGFEAFSFRQTLPQGRGLGLKFLEREGAQPLLQLVDLLDQRSEPADFPLVLRPQDFL